MEPNGRLTGNVSDPLNPSAGRQCIIARLSITVTLHLFVSLSVLLAVWRLSLSGRALSSTPICKPTMCIVSETCAFIRLRRPWNSTCRKINEHNISYKGSSPKKNDLNLKKSFCVPFAKELSFNFVNYTSTS